MNGQEAISCPFFFPHPLTAYVRATDALPMTTASVTPSTTSPPSSTATTIPVWVGVSAFLLSVAAAFGPTLWKLWEMWSIDPNYNHGFLVLPIAIALAERAYRRGGPPGPADGRLGWMAISFGGLFYLASLLFVIPALDFLSLFFLLRGGLLLVGGRDWASRFTFPLAFLVFLFPLPPNWVSYAALWLQDMAAKISETVLSLFVVCNRTGHTIRIAGMDSSLVVAEECSGTRQIIAFLALAALIGHLSGRSVWYKLCLFLTAIPVAIAANVLRVVMMNLGAYWFGTNWMGGWMHDVPALFSLPVGLVLFLAIDRTFTRLFAAPKEPSTPAEPWSLPVGFARRWFVPAVACVALIGVGYGLTRHLAAADATSFPMARGEFSQIPLEFGSTDDSTLTWIGQDLTEHRERVRKVLPFQVDDLLYRGYRTADRTAHTQVYVVHSRTGEDRKHHPEICIREVSGAPEDLAARGKVRLSADGREAQRFRFRTAGGHYMMVYYWHYTFTPERLATSPLQALHQRVGVPAPSITVQVSAPGDDGRVIRAIEQSLLPQLDSAVQRQVLPENTAVGCDRTPIVLNRQ